MKKLAKLRYDPVARLWRSYLRDDRGWFRWGWGFTPEGMAEVIRRWGYRVEIDE